MDSRDRELPLLIDSHAHLCDSRLDANEIIQNMQRDGLAGLVTVGYDMPSSRFNAALAAANENVYATVGVHPSDADKFRTSDLDELLALSSSKKVVAIGEIGLDYHYDDTDKKAQMHALLSQLEVVEKTGLPTVIHLRDAYEDMQKVVTENRSKFRAPAVLHCFSGSKETAQFYIKEGFYISFTGVITYKNAQKYSEIIRSVPKDKLLIETDCPYLAPEPFRGKLNQPSYVRMVAEKMAQILEISTEELAEITRRNTRALFSKMQ